MKLFLKLKSLLGSVGPGFITGAADDDPSGVATYSVAGAQFGYKMTWLTLFLFPAMVAIQEMCGRVGMISGRGLAGVIKKYRSKKMMWFAVSLLAVANIINIGADLGIMAASMEMVLGWTFLGWLIAVAVLIVLMEVFVPYKKYISILKWLGLTLLVYVFTAFTVKQNWVEIFYSTLVPKIDLDMSYVMTMVGFLGTTISPYLFFWQASEEVEEEIANENIKDFNEKPVVHDSQLSAMGLDTKIGMFFSNFVTFFIILTTAATLNKNGIFNIETPQQAALSLKPFAGNAAYFLFTLGIMGIGFQAIPVLAGSIGYAFSEALGIDEGLSKKFSKAKGFYVVIAIATLIGALMNVLGVNTMSALYYAAILNGVISVPLIFIIISLANDKRVVGKRVSGKWQNFVSWLTFGFMFLSVVLMVFNFI